MSDQPCRRHHTVRCDIQRCSEERAGIVRTAQASDLHAAKSGLEDIRRARQAALAARVERDQAYRAAAAQQTAPSGHTNRPGVLRQWRRSKWNLTSGPVS